MPPRKLIVPFPSATSVRVRTMDWARYRTGFLLVAMARNDHRPGTAVNEQMPAFSNFLRRIQHVPIAMPVVTSKPGSHAIAGLRDLVLAGLMLCASALTAHAAEPNIRFGRDVRPILSDHCFACHGPDDKTRKGELRLDSPEGMTARRDGGAPVVPGNPAGSLIFQRIVTKDLEDRMPPAEHGKPLDEAKIAVIRRWIEAGAPWEQHWSFIAPQSRAMPTAGGSWARNPIDRWIRARLEREGLPNASEAPKNVLIRRASLDLTGLPPTADEVASFVADSRPDAYERLIDRLLASPRFGERLASPWLDLARAADTSGYNNDEPRDIVPWRDWLIAAGNSNMPYDRFITEQIAGDLLPDATRDQRIATNFSRNHVINTEGGAFDEEYRVEYVADRVHTTASVLLGLSIACARCHDHKFDPISQKEYYRFFAYFNTIDEKGIYSYSAAGFSPAIELPTPAQEERLAKLRADLAAAEKAVQAEKAAEAGSAAKPAPPAAGDGKPAPEKKPPSANELAVKRLKDEEKALLESIPRALVMREMADPRATRVLNRGAYDQPGEIVSAGVPAFLSPLPSGAPANRLSLARWLTDPANPLVARVEANRLWEMVFGNGLVETSEDFGVQGAAPSDPELLDWLATELVRGGWDRKRLLRTMVTSATYRQSSWASAALIDRDPRNRLLARGPRYRMPAEMLRDNALAVSGLLVERIGGASVKPYQPPGLWEDVSVERRAKYVPASGDGLYRRGLYSFWKRTCPPPAPAAFDAPDRETCVIRRGRTNTPLQALVLMNDPTYVEAARTLAERAMSEGGSVPAGVFDRIFRLVLARAPAESELDALTPLLDAARGGFRANPKAAADLLAVGQSKPVRADDATNLAAWTTVASVILGLDETVTKE